MKVGLPTQGKITSEIWREFQVDWTTELLRVPEVSESEARRVLQTRLNPYLSNIVIEEEYARNNRNPKVGVKFPGPFSGEDVVANIQAKLGFIPRSLHRKGPETWHVAVSNLQEAELLQTWQGEFI